MISSLYPYVCEKQKKYLLRSCFHPLSYCNAQYVIVIILPHGGTILTEILYYITATSYCTTILLLLSSIYIWILTIKHIDTQMKREKEVAVK